MDYNHYLSHSNLDYMMAAGFAELCRQDSCIKLNIPVFSVVQQDCGIL
jgi:hypothetical protein